MSILLPAVGAHSRRLFVVVAAFLLPLLCPDAGLAASAKPSFFGSREIRSADTSRFKSWHAVLQRYADERDRAEPSAYGPWFTLLDSIRDANPRQQLSAVNTFMNSRRYESDSRNWGVKDYWASPAEFLSRSAGDCEDYVIAKYLSLKALGWKEEDLRFVAVKDLRTGIDHAVLVAFYNGYTLVLDNNSESVMHAEQLPHYRPIYSINRTSWWLHRSGSRV